MYKVWPFLFVVSFLILGSAAGAAPLHGIKILPTNSDTHGYALSPQARADVTSTVSRVFNPTQFREIRVHVMRGPSGQIDHLIVYLLRPGYHQMRTAVIYVDAQFNVQHVAMDYHIQKSDVLQEVRRAGLQEKCPDPSVQFIAFAPNDDDLEQQVTVQVAQAAQSKGLKTVSLLKENATAQNYLDYMSCPNVIGNFYDGDANPGEITTVDGSITSDEFANLLKGDFRFKVTNIWLACEAFNDPMLSVQLNVTESQKYYAGINDLQVGPSDRAAACTMTAAINGQSISESFAACYKQYDNADDHWGGQGKGADFLGK